MYRNDEPTNYKYQLKFYQFIKIKNKKSETSEEFDARNAEQQ